MSNQIAISNLYDQLTDFQVSNENETLGKIRQQAFEQFKSYGFPNNKSEYWRFTNPTQLVSNTYQIGEADAIDDAELQKIIAEKSIPNLDAYLLVMVNGSLNTQFSTLPTQAGIQIKKIEDESDSEIFLSNINKQLDLDNVMNAFVAVNTFSFKDGYAIEVKKGFALDKPLVILEIFNSQNDVFLNPRNYVYVNEGAQLDVIDLSYCVGNAQYFINSTTDVYVASDAMFRHILLQSGKRNENWINHNQVDQAANSHYQNYVYSVPTSKFVRNNLNVELNGEHTETHMYGLNLTGKDQLVDNHTLVSHRQPNCDSFQQYKSVVLDNGKSVFNGRIYVHPDAQKTNAYQSNKNMIFSPEGTVNAKPQLEIYADDVKCSHGTTIGQLDPIQLFYLQSRGIDEVQAKAMLVNAFAFDITGKIKNEALREYIENLFTTNIAANTDK